MLSCILATEVVRKGIADEKYHRWCPSYQSWRGGCDLCLCHLCARGRLHQLSQLGQLGQAILLHIIMYAFIYYLKFIVTISLKTELTELTELTQLPPTPKVGLQVNDGVHIRYACCARGVERQAKAIRDALMVCSSSCWSGWLEGHSWRIRWCSTMCQCVTHLGISVSLPRANVEPRPTVVASSRKSQTCAKVHEYQPE